MKKNNTGIGPGENTISGHAYMYKQVTAWRKCVENH